jgi:hypothetical protein
VGGIERVPTNLTPHCEQNFAAGLLTVPQAVHGLGADAPQALQNFASSANVA